MYDLNLSAVTATALFAAATSITPGPNNTMLLASGVNFGFRKTLPHLLGVSIGLLVILLLASAGLKEWVTGHSQWQEVMKWLGSAYLLFLAWRVATSQSETPSRDISKFAVKKTTSDSASNNDQLQALNAPRPLGFWSAAAFQWVNPKVWVMVLGFFSAYVPANTGLAGTMLLCLLFSCINLPCVGAWAVLGDRLSRWLTRGRRRLWFNRSMGALLALSVWGSWSA